MGSLLNAAVRLHLAVAALLSISGCASAPGQTSGGDKVPSYIPTDRWYASTRHFNGGVAAADRNAALILGCDKAGTPMTLLVSPIEELPIDYGVRPVTIILDRGVTYVQDWVSLDAGYSIDSTASGFSRIIADLQKHKEVELVLGSPEAKIDSRSFTLSGAKAAIDTVLAACEKS